MRASNPHWRADSSTPGTQHLATQTVVQRRSHSHCTLTARNGGQGKLRAHPNPGGYHCGACNASDETGAADVSPTRTRALTSKGGPRAGEALTFGWKRCLMSCRRVRASPSPVAPRGTRRRWLYNVVAPCTHTIRGRACTRVSRSNELGSTPIRWHRRMCKSAQLFRVVYW